MADRPYLQGCIDQSVLLCLFFQINSYLPGLLFYFSGISASSSLPILLPSGDLIHSLATGPARKTTGTTHPLLLVGVGDWISIITLRLLQIDRYCF